MALTSSNPHILKTKKATVAHFRTKLYTDTIWATRALLRLYEYQTEDEKSLYSAQIQNGRGFNKVDAELLTAFAKRIRMNLQLSDNQVRVLHKRIQKYAKQLVEISLEETTNQRNQNAKI